MTKFYFIKHTFVMGLLQKTSYWSKLRKLILNKTTKCSLPIDIKIKRNILNRIRQYILNMFFSWRRKYGTSSVENLSKTRQSEFIENKIRWHHFKGHHHSRIVFIDIALRNKEHVLISKGFCFFSLYLLTHCNKLPIPGVFRILIV